MPLPINNASSRLASAHLSGSDALVLREGEGERFGSPTVESPIRVTVTARSTLVNGQVAPTSTLTIFDCTTRVGDTLSGLTAVEGTSDQNFTRNDPVACLITAGTISEITADVSGKADDDAVVKLAGDQTKTDGLTLDGTTIKPDTKPLHWKTTPGVDRRGHTFTVTTNGGYPFTDGVNTLYDDIRYAGWNLGLSLNPDYDPDHPTWYDSWEDAYLQPDGSILGEWNLEGNGPGWSQLMRWRSLSFDQSNGHGAITYALDYFRVSNQTGSFTPYVIGPHSSYGIGPFGVYEVEKTAGGTGYTNGTGYALIFTGGGGSGAAGTFDVVVGAVTNVRLTQSGKNYATAPTVSFANGGAGTGATAQVLLGSISSYIPLNCRQPIGATEFILADTSASNRTYLVGAVGGFGMFSGYNINEAAGVFSARQAGAVSGVVMGASGTLDLIANASVAAGATVTSKVSVAATGAITHRLSSDSIAYKVTLPGTQTVDLWQILKPDTSYLVQINKDGWIGINPGAGAQAPIDVTKATGGVFMRGGANGVAGLFSVGYDLDGIGDITIAGSNFGPTQLKSGTNRDINLKPNGTGVVGLFSHVTVTDAKNFAFGTTTGTKIGTATTQKIGFFNATPIVQPTMGAATAGGTYTATEQAMLQKVYDVLRNLGLGS